MVLTIGLTIALITGVFWEKLAQAYRDVTSARGRLKGAKRIRRAELLRFAGIAAVVFFLTWPYLHRGH